MEKQKNMSAPSASRRPRAFALKCASHKPRPPRRSMFHSFGTIHLRWPARKPLLRLLNKCQKKLARSLASFQFRRHRSLQKIQGYFSTPVLPVIPAKLLTLPVASPQLQPPSLQNRRPWNLLEFQPLSLRAAGGFLPVTDSILEMKFYTTLMYLVDTISGR